MVFTNHILYISQICEFLSLWSHNIPGKCITDLQAFTLVFKSQFHALNDKFKLLLLCSSESGFFRRKWSKMIKGGERKNNKWKGQKDPSAELSGPKGSLKPAVMPLIHTEQCQIFALLHLAGELVVSVVIMWLHTWQQTAQTRIISNWLNDKIL